MWHLETDTQAFNIKFNIYTYTLHQTNKNVTINIQASIGPSKEPMSKYGPMGYGQLCQRSSVIRGYQLNLWSFITLLHPFIMSYKRRLSPFMLCETVSCIPCTHCICHEYTWPLWHFLWLDCQDNLENNGNDQLQNQIEILHMSTST